MVVWQCKGKGYGPRGNRKGNTFATLLLATYSSSGTFYEDGYGCVDDDGCGGVDDDYDGGDVDDDGGGVDDDGGGVEDGNIFQE